MLEHATSVKRLILAYQFLEHAVVQFHLWFPTLEEVVVVVFEALPVCVELLHAVRIDILDPDFQFNVRYSPK